MAVQGDIKGEQMINVVREYVRRQQYQPSWLGMWLNPFYHSRRGLYDAMSIFSKRIKGTVLDAGCGRKPYRDLFEVNKYIGLEVDTPGNRQKKSADLFYDGTLFPFEDGTFDSVVCNQVLEHVFRPDQFLQEIHRVLKADGLLLLSVPFVWDEHEQPHDYARYSSFGLNSLLIKNGFEVLEHRKINPDMRVIFQLVNAYLYKILWTRWQLINLLLCVVVMSPCNVLGLILGKVLPDNPDLFLDQVVLARKTES